MNSLIGSRRLMFKVTAVVLLTASASAQTRAPGGSDSGGGRLPGSAQLPAPAAPGQVDSANPEMQELLERIQKLETSAAAEALMIHKLKRTGGSSDETRRLISNCTQKLNDALNTAFDLKLELEERKVRELKERLRRFETQIAERKELRQRIVSHRADELMGSQSLNWELNTGDVETSKTANVPGGSYAKIAGQQGIQLKFSGPKGLELTVEGFPYKLIVPSRLQFPWPVGQSKRRTVAIEKFSEAANRQFGALLDIYPLDERMQQKLSGVAIPVRFSDEDLLKANEGNLLILVTYLPNTTDSPGQTDSPALATETIVTSRSLPGTDPMGDIEKRGKIVVVLQLAGSLERFGVTAPFALSEISMGEPQSETSISSQHGDELKAKSQPSIDDLRKELEPIAKRIADQRARVRELEPVFFVNRSTAAELEKAMDELNASRREWRLRSKVLEPLSLRLSMEEDAAKAIANSFESRWTMLKNHSSTKQDEFKKVLDSMLQANDVYSAAHARVAEFESAFLEMVPSEDSEGEFVFSPKKSHLSNPDPGCHPSVAKAWMECVTGLKLELVKIADLKLGVDFALRVIEAEEQFRPGDLIGLLDGQPFRSWNEAVAILKPFSRHGSGAPPNIAYLHSGLSGAVRVNRLDMMSWDHDKLSDQNGHAVSTVRVELRVRKKNSDELESMYATGTCISPEGLFVVPFFFIAVPNREDVVVFETTNLEGGRPSPTGRIVASDEAHGLLLLKVNPPSRSLFYWRKCSEVLPIKNQVIITDAVGVEFNVTEVNKPWPKPFEGTDAFVITAKGPLTPSVNLPNQGQALYGVDQTIQGILTWEGAIPAIHVQKLLDRYRQTFNAPIGAQF